LHVLQHVQRGWNACIAGEAAVPAGCTTVVFHAAVFVLALDGEPLAYTAPHGGTLDWLPAAARLA
jgi:hypothetical protein